MAKLKLWEGNIGGKKFLFEAKSQAAATRRAKRLAGGYVAVKEIKK